METTVISQTTYHRSPCFCALVAPITADRATPRHSRDSTRVREQVLELGYRKPPPPTAASRITTLLGIVRAPSRLCAKSVVFSAKSIVLSTKSIVFSEKSIDFRAKFIDSSTKLHTLRTMRYSRLMRTNFIILNQ